MDSVNKINNLKSEKSAHLQEHAHDLIQWSAFSIEALKEAQKQERPVFISISYSANYLSAVMREESFIDEETAALLNDNFINIKIDKDEYPDLALYFQLASQVSTNKGGWPINAFVSNDLSPLYVGTYFSKDTKDEFNFKNVIHNVLESYNNNKEEFFKNSEKIQEIISEKPQTTERLEFEGHFPLPAAILNAIKDYQDNENGGYGGAPKLNNLSFYEYAVEQVLEGMIPEEFANHIIESIEKMLMGGLYDHAKGGIHPFSRDAKFLVPNFEKHLYDQAALLRVLIKTSLIYPSPLVYDAIIQTIDYLETEMLSEENFFFTAQAAGSEGVDGLYFTFSKDEFIDAVVDYDEELSDRMNDLVKYFNITDEGNFSKDLNVISLNHELKEQIYDPKNWDLVRKVKMALMEARKDRIPPRTDSKGVAAYNFQILSALIDVIQYSNIEIISSSAFNLLSKTFEPIHNKFITIINDKSVIKNATSIDREVGIFDNYVSLLELALRFYEISGNEQFLTNAKGTIQHIMKSFYKDGQIFMRSLDQSALKNIHVPIFDQPHKSSLSTLILNLRKWEKTLDLSDDLQKLEEVVENLTHLSLQNPLAFGETLRAFTYPQEAFKVINVPKAWIEKEMIQQFYPRFSSRFAITYNDSDEKWNIDNFDKTELSGADFQSFEATFKNE